MKKIYLSFLWHMHQPYYKNIETDKFILPWVRLHGVKDYYDMPNILRNYDKIKQTFNLVPSLLKQIDEYLTGTTDIFMDMTLKKASDLNEDERIFILNNFFMANWQTMIYPYKRYAYLLEKRGENTDPDQIKKIHKNFSEQEIRDLQVWFNLTWIDNLFFDIFPDLKKLKEKEENYTEEEKKYVIDVHLKILKMIVPEYIDLQKNNIIEISTSPFYHPILPLLCDIEIAKVSMPYLKLDFDFKHPEDANIQVKNAIDYYERIFSKKPNGMWPSEGSVSDQVLDILIKNNITWTATDEDILKNTIKENNIFIYSPYTYEGSSGNINIFFRNHYLSDLIGFTYQNWNTNDAVNNFIYEIKRIKEENKDKLCCVNIILDGENAWEFYPNDGKDFLNTLYKTLCNDNEIETITFSQAIEIFKDKNRLKNIFPGSWINHDFYIWIGHNDDQQAFKLLKMVRDYLVSQENYKEKELLKKAWEEIYIAEGSDWNWWYGDDHTSKNDAEFDNLFRLHLMNVYKILNDKIPDILYVPIYRANKTFFLQPFKFIYPEIDGKITDFFEWKGAGIYDFSREGAMHNSDRFLKQFFYGFNLENFYLRFDFLKKSFKEDIIMEIKFITEKITGTFKYNIYNKKIIDNLNIDNVLIVFNDILELKIPFVELKKFVFNNEISFIIFILEGENIIEKIPEKGAVKIQMPAEDFEIYNWNV